MQNLVLRFHTLDGKSKPAPGNECIASTLVSACSAHYNCGYGIE